MIYCYTGVPGSGKTLHAASDIRRALAAGRPVIANFDINQDKVKNPHLFVRVKNSPDEPGNYPVVNADWLIDWARGYFAAFPEHRKEGWLLCVFDECQLLWNARRWSDKHRMRWVAFFSQHRKYLMNVILCAQGDKMIDNQFRTNVEMMVVHRNLKHYGTFMGIVSFFFRDRLFSRHTVYYPTHEVISTEFYIARKKDMDVYDTFSTFVEV